MARPKRGLFPALAGLLLGGALLLWLQPWQVQEGGREEPGKEAPGAPATPGKEPAEKETPAPGRRQPLGGKTLPGGAELRLRIVLEDGAPAPGTLYWTSTPGPPLTSDLLAPDQEYALPEDEVRILAHGGRARVAVPPGHWTWLRATGRTRAGLLLGSYRRVPPFEGVKEMEIELRESARGLHVFLLRSDLRGPAAGEEVSLHLSDLRHGGPVRLLRRERTDRWGYALFGDLEPGLFLLCAPGARPGDPPPQTARLILPEGPSTVELSCTLVVPEPTCRVRLKITALFLRGPGPPPKLFLKRRDDRPGQLFPVPGFLRSGEQELQVRVPSGTYELGILPLGEVGIPEEGRSLLVRGNPEFRLALAGNPARTLVELLGLEHGDLPVTVYPRSTGLVCDDRPDLLFTGPHRWRRLRQEIPTPPHRVELVALGRTGCWISRDPVRLAGGTAPVAMVPATRLEIRWPGGLEAGAGSSWVEVSGSWGSKLLPLTPGLMTQGGRTLAALLGRIVVPRGQLFLKGRDPEGGAPIWSRTVLARRPYQVVEIP